MIVNLAFYRFVDIAEPPSLAEELLAVCRSHELLGTVILAEEGINGMIAGVAPHADALVEWLRSDERFASMPVKRSTSKDIPFRRLNVKVKPEIVTMRTPGVTPGRRTAPHLAPETFRQWLRGDEEIILIDTRNDFEVQMGTFRGAINPHTTSFSEFPDWVERHRDELHDRKVVMFCTGGIRCEKATSWMIDEGFSDVFQLDGGVLNYFAAVDDADRDWEGELFVFDERERLDTRLNENN